MLISTPPLTALIEVIEQSSFGSMLAMVGGSEALQPMREPFITKMKVSIIDMAQTDEFNSNIKTLLAQSNIADDMFDKVSLIIEQRLNELTPKLVKEIIQSMIKKHLGWLVVWGAFLVGYLGLLLQLFNIYHFYYKFIFNYIKTFVGSISLMILFYNVLLK